MSNPCFYFLFHKRHFIHTPHIRNFANQVNRLGKRQHLRSGSQRPVGRYYYRFYKVIGKGNWSQYEERFDKPRRLESTQRVVFSTDPSHSSYKRSIAWRIELPKALAEATNVNMVLDAWIKFRFKNPKRRYQYLQVLQRLLDVGGGRRPGSMQGVVSHGEGFMTSGIALFGSSCGGVYGSGPYGSIHQSESTLPHSHLGHPSGTELNPNDWRLMNITKGIKSCERRFINKPRLARLYGRLGLVHMLEGFTKYLLPNVDILDTYTPRQISWILDAFGSCKLQDKILFDKISFFILSSLNDFTVADLLLILRGFANCEYGNHQIISEISKQFINNKVLTYGDICTLLYYQTLLNHRCNITVDINLQCIDLTLNDKDNEPFSPMITSLPNIPFHLLASTLSSLVQIGCYDIIIYQKVVSHLISKWFYWEPISTGNVIYSMSRMLWNICGMDVDIIDNRYCWIVRYKNNNSNQITIHKQSVENEKLYISLNTFLRGSVESFVNLFTSSEMMRVVEKSITLLNDFQSLTNFLSYAHFVNFLLTDEMGGIVMTEKEYSSTEMSRRDILISIVNKLISTFLVIDREWSMNNEFDVSGLSSMLFDLKVHKKEVWTSLVRRSIRSLEFSTPQHIIIMSEVLSLLNPSLVPGDIMSEAADCHAMWGVKRKNEFNEEEWRRFVSTISTKKGNFYSPQIYILSDEERK